MGLLRKLPAVLLAGILFFCLASGALFPARCLAQQPEAPSAAGQGEPQGNGAERRVFRGNGVIGKIESIAPEEMKISTPEGVTVTVHLSSKTAFRLEQQPAKRENFKAGMMVFVRGTKASDGSWDAEAVAARTGAFRPGGGPDAMGGVFMAGKVKAIEGTKITLLRQDDTSQTFEVDENTSLRKRRESITLADIHIGDTVVARGELKDGVFVPKSVNVVDAEQFQRMRQFMGAGGSPNDSTAPPAQTPPSDRKPPRELR